MEKSDGILLIECQLIPVMKQFHFYILNNYRRTGHYRYKSEPWERNKWRVKTNGTKNGTNLRYKN